MGDAPGGSDASLFHELFFGVLGNAIWTIVAALVAAVYVSTKSRSRFSGRWRAMIKWESKWAESHLMGRASHDANSDGEISLSYGSGPKKDRYWGLSVWRLRDGSEVLAELCVELHEVQLQSVWTWRPPFVRYALASTLLNSRIRREVGTFEYPKRFANYVVRFSKATSHDLFGSIEASADGNRPARTVGTLRAERVS